MAWSIHIPGSSSRLQAVRIFPMVRLLACVVVCAQFAWGLKPVLDFRVADLHGPRDAASVLKGANVAVKEAIGGAQTQLLLVTVSTVTLLPQLAPTVDLSPNVHVLYTDALNSVYYLNTSIYDTVSEYNQTFSLLLDTGSANSWIYNASCDLPTCTANTRFSDSRQLKAADTFDLTYSGDSVQGLLLLTEASGLEVVFDDLVVTNYTFGLAQNLPQIFNDVKVDGIIGILANVLQNADRNLIYQLHQQGLIDKRMLGLLLVATDQTVQYTGSKNLFPSSYGGLVIFGSDASDDSHKYISADSDLHYTDVLPNQNSYWLIEVSSVELSNSSWTGPLGGSRDAIIDTGTTGLALPIDDADAIHAALFGSDYVTDKQGNYAFFCNRTDANIGLEISGHTFNLLATAFRASAYTSQGLQGYCASKIQGLSNTQQWVLGAAFLSNFYTIFDLDNGQIGFADARITTYSLDASDSSQGGNSVPKLFANSTNPAPNSPVSSTSVSASGSSSQVPKPKASNDTSSSGSSKVSGATRLEAGLHSFVSLTGITMVATVFIWAL